MKPRTPEADAAIRALSIYLEGQRERVGYNELRRRGLPRGSGGVGSANKLICHMRLKRSGAWRLEANGNAMLRIRCALYNGTFERIQGNLHGRHVAVSAWWIDERCGAVEQVREKVPAAGGGLRRDGRRADREASGSCTWVGVVTGSRVFRGKFVESLRRANVRGKLDLAGATATLRDPKTRGNRVVPWRAETRLVRSRDRTEIEWSGRIECDPGRELVRGEDLHMARSRRKTTSADAQQVHRAAKSRRTRGSGGAWAREVEADLHRTDWAACPSIHDGHLDTQPSGYDTRALN
jgi:hypothetical protein